YSEQHFYRSTPGDRLNQKLSVCRRPQLFADLSAANRTMPMSCACARDEHSRCRSPGAKKRITLPVSGLETQQILTRYNLARNTITGASGLGKFLRPATTLLRWWRIPQRT